MTIVKLDGVTRSFGEKQVLGGVSLQIEKGEIFGLLGPSGAGKTTLVNILTGQMPCGGKAEIFGMDCARIGREVYRRTGAVLDNCGLYERLTCMDNMCRLLPKRCGRWGWTAAKDCVSGRFPRVCGSG